MGIITCLFIPLHIPRKDWCNNFGSPPELDPTVRTTPGLPHFKNSEAEAKDFKRFLEFAQVKVDKRIQHGLSQDEFVSRMFFATEGVVANIMNLVRFAALLCEKRQEAVITLEVLDLAFNKRLQRHLDKPPNPFSTPLENILVGLSGESNQKTNQGHRRTRSVNEVLTK